MANSLRCSFLTPLVVLAIVLFAFSAHADTPQKPDRTAARALDKARAQADAPRWNEIATLSLEIALQVPGTEPGRDAVQLYFEAFDHLQRQDPAPNELYEQLRSATPNLVAGYCQPNDIATHPEPCGTLIQIQFDFQHIGDTIPTTPIPIKTPEGIQFSHLRTAESLVKLWHDMGERLCLAKSTACLRIAGVLDSAAHHFRAAHRTERAMETRRIVLDPRYGVHQSRLATRTLCDGAEDLDESLLDFPEAASWYERCAHEESSFRPMGAFDPFKRAVELRLLLNDEPSAKRDMEAFEQAVGAINRVNSARLALTIADHALRAKRFNDAEKWLEHKKVLFERTTDTDVQVLFHTYQARIAAGKARQERAFAEYGTVRHLWKNAPADVKSRNSSIDVQSFATILEAVGEAEFFFAQRSERAVDAIQCPPYRGPTEEKPLLQYIRECQELQRKKQKAIEHASDVYENVLHTKPVAAPRWIIAAANRVGTLWATFADDVENIPNLTGPVPGGDGITYEEERKAYEGRVWSPSRRDRAKKVFTFCVQHALRFQHFDENARHCERWLADHEPSPRRVVDELQDTPSHAAFGIQTRLIDSVP